MTENTDSSDMMSDENREKLMIASFLGGMAAGFVGGPPCTTYAEVIGAVSLTRVFNPAVMTWAAMCSILLSFVAKIGAFLGSIPVPVMGGIMILLFHTTVQKSQHFSHIADQARICLNIFINLCRIDINLQDLCIICKFLCISGNTVTETHADGNQKITFTNAIIGCLCAMHAKHTCI